jgi:hypothetical protein
VTAITVLLIVWKNGVVDITFSHMAKVPNLFSIVKLLIGFTQQDDGSRSLTRGRVSLELSS